MAEELGEEVTHAPSELLTRLKEARGKRTEYEDGNPPLRYCLRCDDLCLSVEEGPMCYRRLECRHDHHEYILEEGYENVEITAWINCMEYLGVTE